MNSSTRFARLAGLASLSLVAVFATGCAGADGSSGDPAPADGTAEGTTVDEAAATAASEEALSGSADAAQRREILRRAHSWINEHVMYSQSQYHHDANGTYRQDCSGYVSMAWGLGTSTTTYGFAPFGRAYSHPISWHQLLPGDALNSAEHVVLFVGWADRGHSVAIVEQEGHSGSPAQRITWALSYGLGSYHPIRSNKLR